MEKWPLKCQRSTQGVDGIFWVYFRYYCPPACCTRCCRGGTSTPSVLVPSLCLSFFSSYQDPSRPERGGNPHHEVPTVAKDSWSQRTVVSITPRGWSQAPGHGQTPSEPRGELSPVAGPAAQPQWVQPGALQPALARCCGAWPRVSAVEVGGPFRETHSGLPVGWLIYCRNVKISYRLHPVVSYL